MVQGSGHAADPDGAYSPSCKVPTPLILNLSKDVVSSLPPPAAQDRRQDQATRVGREKRAQSNRS